MWALQVLREPKTCRAEESRQLRYVVLRGETQQRRACRSIPDSGTSGPVQLRGVLIFSCRLLLGSLVGILGEGVREEECVRRSVSQGPDWRHECAWLWA